MGCNCKSKKKSTNKVEKSKESNSKVNWGGFLPALGISVGITLGMPFIWGVSVYNIFKNRMFDDAVDISGLITQIFKKKKEEVSNENDMEEINPEDYELVGVEKVE